MNDTMMLRGPDDSGFFISGHFGMAMRRLAIIDVEGGHQPISNEDGSIHIVLNGEIYNYLELREELQKRGHRFKTLSDVEVLVHLYEEKGVAAIDDLNGMFAFCLWDDNRKRAWIARDRLGVKPLAYFYGQGLFAFASTVDALFTLPQLSKSVDKDSLLLYLGLAYVPAPRSMYKGVQKLLPGHWALLEENNLRVEQYWDVLSQKQREMGHGEFVHEVGRILDDSIRIHARSDVPVGCFLSGGVDSSAVTALFQQYTRKAVHTFAAGFEGKEENELDYADLVVRRYHTHNHQVLFSAESSIAQLSKVLSLMDEPMADSAVIPSYCLALEAQHLGIKVILTGAGGDEIFGGYCRHYPALKNLVAGKLPNIATRLFGLFPHHSPSRIRRLMVQLSDERLDFAIGTSGCHLPLLCDAMRDRMDFYRTLDLLEEQFAPLYVLERERGFIYSRMMLDLLNYLPDNILALTDKTTMAASIEARVPLLDHRLAELVFSVSPDICVGSSFQQAKKSLKKAVAGVVPEEILNRGKMGFNGPVYHWVCNTPTIIDHLSHIDNEFVRDVVDLDKLNIILHDSRLRSQASENLYILYVFDLWCRDHVS